MSDKWGMCALCPRLCRVVCPVATGTGREAATPSAIATVLFGWEKGEWTPAQAASVATLCTDCGACQEHCHLHTPLADHLRQVRPLLVGCPPIDPLGPLEGDGELVAVEADERPLALALAKRLGQPVRRWRTHDRLGVAAVEHPLWARQAHRLRDVVGQLKVVVVDGGVAHALEAAGIGYSWLQELVPGLPIGYASCRCSGSKPPLSCCGAAEPLSRHHPEDAKRVAELWLQRADEWWVADARCREHLRRCNAEVTDPLDTLLVEEGLG
ncbi:MAG: hypothetical protein HN348_07865 [Proteobacteria bacterium]|mgnify:CR=1 FL=1|jgi:hypothetical protein|nr:hypothetical protein [Pseudomonadota bacterium]